MVTSFRLRHCVGLLHLRTLPSGFASSWVLGWPVHRQVTRFSPEQAEMLFSGCDTNEGEHTQNKVSQWEFS